MKVLFSQIPDVKKTNYYRFLRQGFDAVADVGVDPNIPLVTRSKCAVYIIDFVEKDKRVRALYDWADFSRAHFDLMGPEDIYFKIELNKEDLASRIFPIGQIICPKLLNNLLQFRRIKRNRKYTYDVYAVMRTTNYNDRLRCIELVSKQKGWKSMAGLANRKHRPLAPPLLTMKKFSLLEHYTKQCQSRINIAIRGIGEKTWRHMETLGMGCFLLMHETDCVWPADFSGCVAIVKKDFSDLVETIDYYLSHDKEREEIAAAGRNYYDKWLSPEATAKYMIDKAKEFL